MDTFFRGTCPLDVVLILCMYLAPAMSLHITSQNYGVNNSQASTNSAGLMFFKDFLFENSISCQLAYRTLDYSYREVNRNLIENTVSTVLAFIHEIEDL